MVTVIGLALPFIIPISTAPTRVDASSFSASDPYDPTVPVNCSHAVMTTAPRFLSNPKGSAKYPFSMRCTSPVKPGLMTFTWEGSWSPSETRRDRPNASESLTITGYEPFFPNRASGGTIFMYWTGSCTADPWLQGGTCSRFGEYVPDDVRAAMPDIGLRPFPLTGNSISPSLKPQLMAQYQAVNAPPSTHLSNQPSLQSMMIQPQQSQVITQSQRIPQATTVQPTVQPQTAVPKPDTAISSLSRSGIFARGVEEKEGQSPGQQEPGAQPESAETSAMAVVEEGTPEITEPITVTLARPFHSVNAKGDAVEIKPGVYEIGTAMDVQLGLAKEGQQTVLLNAKRDKHSIPIHRTIAVVIPGPSDDLHLLFLTLDGRRFDAVGSESGVKSRSTDKVEALSEKAITDAALAASAKPRSVSSPACQLNPAEIGPRWIPVPCTMPTIPAPAPSP